MKYLVLLGLLVGCNPEAPKVSEIFKDLSFTKLYFKAGECIKGYPEKESERKTPPWGEDKELTELRKKLFKPAAKKILKVSGEFYQYQILEGYSKNLVLTSQTYPPYKSSYYKVDCKTFKKIE